MPDKQKIIIPDAQVIIDLHRIALWSPVVHAFDVGVTPVILNESLFYKDSQGARKPILLRKDIDAQLIREIQTTVDQLAALHGLLKPTIQSPLDPGELEAIAFLKSQKKDDYIFCSGDALAVKYVGALGLRYRSISLQKLLEQKNIKVILENKYSDGIFQKMLNEGFRDSTFLLR
jgi:hypothetical protein